MRKLTEITGRLGNQMYQYAYIARAAREIGQSGHFPNSPHWFAGHEEEVLAMFRDGIGHDDRVSIHVRRSDLGGSNRYYDPLPMSYYERAMALFPEARFLVFSDTIEWCKTAFVGDRFDFSEGKDEIEDMNAMASCHHNIISNSTYSTWAGLLNIHSDKIVVAPVQWETTGWSPVLPASWIRL